MTVTQRNFLVEQYLWCIDSVIWQNEAMVVAAHLDRDDVRQALAERLIQAVSQHEQASGRSLKEYIFDQLNRELIACTSPLAKYGLRDAPHDLMGAVMSLDSLVEDEIRSELRLVA